MRVVYVALGDRHGGHRNGLTMPGTEIEFSIGEEKESYILDDDNLSDWAKWLWYDVWMPGIVKLKDFAGTDAVIVADDGDMTHGAKFIGNDNSYSPHIDQQVQISKMALTPLRELPGLSAFFLSYGTAAHDYGSNSAARLVAEAIAPWGYDVISDYHVIWNHDGFRLDLAHKGPNSSSRPHLRLNSARTYGEDRIRKSLEFGKPYANLYQRGHFHRPVVANAAIEWADELHQTTVMITPPLCGPNGYARDAARSPETVTCGFYYYEVIDGRMGEIQAHLVTKDTRAYYTPNRGMPFFSNMIKDGGHKKRKKKRRK